jgi:hypothetical protein
MTQSQIAQEVGISQVHVSRALAELREKLLVGGVNCPCEKPSVPASPLSDGVLRHTAGSERTRVWEAPWGQAVGAQRPIRASSPKACWRPHAGPECGMCLLLPTGDGGRRAESDLSHGGRGTLQEP